MRHGFCDRSVPVQPLIGVDIHGSFPCPAFRIIKNLLPTQDFALDRDQGPVDSRSVQVRYRSDQMRQADLVLGIVKRTCQTSSFVVDE